MPFFKRVVAAFVLLLMLATLPIATVPIATAATSPSQPAGTIVHGAFEIVVKARRIGTGTFPNQGGGLFSSHEVAQFQVRWRGKAVSTAGGNGDYWRVVRLTGAPRPALLLITQGFWLATEDASGQLQISPIKSASASLAEMQWLDAKAGQPGESMTFGIEHLPNIEEATQASGGRWLRFGSLGVLDVSTLKIYTVTPWVTILPGVPDTTLSREGDEVRLFSPGRSKYVLRASGYDYAVAGQPRVYGLLVVDIASGATSELRFDRKRFRYSFADDMDAQWIAHHFEWQRDAKGNEQLQARKQFKPWPWRSKWVSKTDDQVVVIYRADSRLVSVLRRTLLAQPGAKEVAPSGGQRDSSKRDPAIDIQGCVVEILDHSEGQDRDEYTIEVNSKSEASKEIRRLCEVKFPQIVKAIDAELATGRHDAILEY